MTDIATFLLSLSILFPLITSLIRWRTIRPRYYPLMILFGLGLASELYTRYAIARNTMAWTTGNNLYVLLESLLIPFQFMVWGYMTKARMIYYAMMILLLCGWILEYLIFGNIERLQPYFRMSYSLVIVLLSINMLNYLVINEEKALVKHPAFIICTGFIIFFTYQLVYEGIYHIVSDLETINTRILNATFSIINCCCNILYGIALILVPDKPRIQWLEEKTATRA